MKDLLVVFVVLLVLLILISALGGSIHPREPFSEKEVREAFWEEESQSPPPAQPTDSLVTPPSATPPPPANLPAPLEKQETFTEHKEKFEVKKAEHFYQHPEEKIVEGFDGDQWASY